MGNILKKCTVVKLKEYSQSYGKPETIAADYIIEEPNSITLLDKTGGKVRTFRKGTRILVSFDGHPISAEAFEAEKERARNEQHLKYAAEMAAWAEDIKRRQQIAARQLEVFKTLLTPERAKKYRSKLAEMNNSKGRNYLMMKAAKHVNGGKFEGLHVSSGDLKRLVLTD